MARKHSVPADKGSQYHLQKLVNEHKGNLNRLILSNSSSLSEYALEEPKWVSPLAPEYLEYRDHGFLRAIRLSRLEPSLSAFWPRFGPYWDALATVDGKNGGHGVILLEAKSHFKELGGRSYRAKAKRKKSIEKITVAIATVKQRLEVKEDSDWLGNYFQYANRLVHLYWLNKEGVPTWMVFLYFNGDQEQNCPNTFAEWQGKLNEMRTELGLPEHHLLSDKIINVFPSVYPRK